MMWWDDEPTPASTPAPDPAVRDPEQKISAAPSTPPMRAVDVGGSSAASNTYYTIFGIKGMGKTTLMRQLYAARVLRGRNGTFIDRIGNNGDLARITAGGAIVRSPQGWFAEVRKAIAARRPYNIVLQPGRGSIKEMGKFWAMCYEVGDALLAIDEIEAFANAQVIDPHLKELIALGRNQRIDMACTVRVPPELHRSIRGNADVVVSFKQHAHYAETLNDEYFHIGGTGPKAQGVKVLQQLPRFHYLRAEDDTLTMGTVSPQKGKAA